MENITQALNINDPRFIFLLLWSLFWKGWALWRAAQNKQKIWFVAILVINLFGILEIVYLLFFQKEEKLWKKLFLKTSSKKK